MAAGNTFSQIASTTLGSAAATVTFSSIPSTYTDLVLVVNGVETTNRIDATVTVGNGTVDTGTNYSRTGLSGNGTSASSYRTTNETSFAIDAAGAANGAAFFTFNLMNYANTTTYKTGLARITGPADYTRAVVHLWRSTAAINIMTITGNYTFKTGSTFNLYGILAA